MGKKTSKLVCLLAGALVGSVAKAWDLPAEIRLRPRKGPFTRDNCHHCACAKPPIEFDLIVPLPDLKLPKGILPNIPELQLPQPTPVKK